jgi:hypothetical protein
VTNLILKELEMLWQALLYAERADVEKVDGGIGWDRLSKTGNRVSYRKPRDVGPSTRREENVKASSVMVGRCAHPFPDTRKRISTFLRLRHAAAITVHTVEPCFLSCSPQYHTSLTG